MRRAWSTGSHGHALLMIVFAAALAAFTARVAAPEPGCPVPPANLGAFSMGGELYNYVQIGGRAVGVQERTWSAWKAGYR